MGCCLSRLSNDEQSTATQERQEEALSTHQSDHHSRQQDSDNSPRDHSRPRRQGVALPLDQHYNRPIRPHVWRSKRRLWTRTQIDREREEFFDTRVTGRAEVWAALRAALSLLRDGETETAQGIIDAAGATVPTGDLCEGVYDENGVLYRLSQCIVSDPDNIVDDSSAAAGETDGGDDDIEDGISDRKIVSEESDEELISDDVERRREEKGKMSERDMIRVQARLSDRGGPDVIIPIGKMQTVSVLARKIHSEVKMPNTQRVRIVYLGRMLQENEPLIDQGWKPGQIINAMVVARIS